MCIRDSLRSPRDAPPSSSAVWVGGEPAGDATLHTAATQCSHSRKHVVAGRDRLRARVVAQPPRPQLGADRDGDCSCACVLCPGMFSGDMGRHPRRNRSAAAPPRTQGHVAGQSIHGRHGPTTAPIATGHAHAHLIRHRACEQLEQTCPAPTARPATPGRGCHRPPRPTFAVTVQEHLNSARDHQKKFVPPPRNWPVHFSTSTPKLASELFVPPVRLHPETGQ